MIKEAFTLVLEQSPSLAGLAVLAYCFWTIFKRNLEENRTTLGNFKSLFDNQKNGVDSHFSQHKDSVDLLLKEYKEMLEGQKKEIDRHRINFSALLDDKARADKNHEESRKEYYGISLENSKLKRALDNIEEMLKATGGDVKYIQKELLEQRKDLDVILRIEHKKD